MKDQDQRSDAHTVEPDRFDGSDRDEGLVDRLVKLADPGPEIPTDGANRIREAIRPAWRREVRARSRRRLLWGAGSVAATAVVAVAVTLVFLAGRGSIVPVDPVGHLAVVFGTVELESPNGERSSLGEADAGIEILPGSVVRTGNSSRAAFTLADGHSLRMDAGSELGIEGQTVVMLVDGAVYLDSDDTDGSGLEVRTSFGTAREIGTQFEVRRMDDSLTIRVREGRVALSRDAEDLMIDQGTTLTIAPDGSRSAAAIPTYDPAWDWTQSVAPAFELEGRSASDLLDWVSRETGLWVSFSSPEVEAAARKAVLHGSLAGVSPAEAPDLVLPGCGLEAARGIGTLTIRDLSGGG